MLHLVGKIRRGKARGVSRSHEEGSCRPCAVIVQADGVSRSDHWKVVVLLSKAAASRWNGQTWDVRGGFAKAVTQDRDKMKSAN